MLRVERYNLGEKVKITMPCKQTYHSLFTDGDPGILFYGIAAHYVKDLVGTVATIGNWYCNEYGGKETYSYNLLNEQGSTLGYVFPWWMLTPHLTTPTWEV